MTKIEAGSIEIQSPRSSPAKKDSAFKIANKPNVIPPIRIENKMERRIFRILTTHKEEESPTINMVMITSSKNSL